MSIIEKALNKALELEQSSTQKGGERAQFAQRAADIEPSSPAPGTASKSEAAPKIHPIDWDLVKSKGMLALDAPHGQLAEEYRLIKRPLDECLPRR